MTRTDLHVAVMDARDKTTDPEVLNTLNALYRKIESVYAMLFIIEEELREHTKEKIGYESNVGFILGATTKAIRGALED